MTLAFTLCSVNYLAQAHTLGNSLKSTNPDIQFFIGLVDKFETKILNNSLLPPFPFLEVDKIEIQDFDGMCERYDITELNTAVKPFYFQYFLKNFPQINKFIYFDPDIIVFDKLTDLDLNLDKYNFILTPHITIPYNDDLWQNEEDVVNTGVYNLGFVAIKRSSETQKLIQWWCNKLENECTIDLCNGLFVDQHWMEFTPVFFDKGLINKHLGYNVAYWNLHERQIHSKENKWFVNESIALQFFHYSGYLIAKPNEVSKYQNRIDFETRKDIVPLFELYKNQLLENNELYWKNFKCDYIKPKKIKRFLRVRKIFQFPYKFLLKILK